jgi:hypothetical protein
MCIENCRNREPKEKVVGRTTRKSRRRKIWQTTEVRTGEMDCVKPEHTTFVAGRKVSIRLCREIVGSNDAYAFLK